MGCGSSKAQYSTLQQGSIDMSKQDMSRIIGQGQEQGKTSRPVADDQEQPEGKDNKNTVSGQKVNDAMPVEVLEMDKDEHLDNNNITDDNTNLDSRISDVISVDIKQGSEKHRLLKDASVDMFVEAGKKLIRQINEMSLNLEDMPANFKAASKLRLVYHNARYNRGANFCTLYLDEIMKEGLFYCLTQALRKLHEKWPELFSETSDPKEVFKPSVSKITLEDFSRPEMSVASVWGKLNETVMGATDLHEGSRIRATEDGILEYLLITCIPALSKGEYPGVKTVRGKLLQKAISTVYNCSMSTTNIPYFDKFDGVTKLLRLMGSPNERLNMTVLFALAYLIDEKNNHLIMSTNETIDKIIHFLSNANNVVSRRYCGLSNIEIADALTRIAVNDDNKKMLGKRNGLLPLVKMFSSAKSDVERISSANALWMLLFDTDNQECFKSIDNAFETISSYKNSDNRSLSKAISGIIWELKTKYELQEKAGSTQDVQNEESQCKHVMISYNWEQQPLMLKIRDALKNSGYKVWMDVDKIGGSTLQAMASAVENSAVILVGVSRKYKESANCRSEAEYAFQLRKNIVPLMLEKHYQPDGWLGFIVGAKFWIDFTDRIQFTGDFSKLVREIGERGKLGNELIHPIDVVDLGAPPGNTVQTKADQIKCWVNVEVQDWLSSKNHLDKAMKKSILDKLTGSHLVSLFKLRQESPEFFFNSVRQDFGFNDVLDQLDFTDALEELINAS